MKKICLMIIMFSWAGVVWSDPITFDQAVQKSFENNTGIVNARKDLTIATATVEQTYGMFDFTLTGNVLYSDKLTEATTPFSPEGTKVLSYGLGLSEKTMLGGFFNLGLDSSKTELFYPSLSGSGMFTGLDLSSFTSTLNPTYNPTLTLRYEQPLLKDFWGRPDQIALKIADDSISLAEIGLKQVMLEQLTSLTSAYLGILQAEATLKIQEESLADTQKYYQQTLRMKKIGLREDKDVFQTQASYLKAKANISSAADIVAQAKEQFYYLAGYDQNDWAMMDINPEPLFNEFNLPEMLSATTEKKLIDEQPGVVLKTLQIQMNEMNKKIAANATLPSLSLFGKYGIEGVDESWGAGFSEMVDTKYTQYAVGINFSMKLPNRTSEGDLKIKQQDLGKAQEELNSLRQALSIQIRYAYKTLLSSKEKYELNKEARVLIEKSLEIHNRYFSQGRITTAELLGAQSSYHGSRIEEVTAMINYLRAINEWKKLSGAYEKMIATSIKE